MIYLPITILKWKLAFIAWSFPFTALAVTEAFLGQMAISLMVALIGAAPPTVAIIMLSRKQSLERKDAHKVLLDNQVQMKQDLDGKLDKLSKAETGQARAEGIIEGGEKEQARVAVVTPVVAPPVPVKVKIVNDKTDPGPNRPGGRAIGPEHVID